MSDRAYYTAYENSCIIASVALDELCPVKYITSNLRLGFVGILYIHTRISPLWSASQNH